MDIISARKSVGRITGQVLVNGVPRGADFTRKTAYVPQVGPDQAGPGWWRGAGQMLHNSRGSRALPCVSLVLRSSTPGAACVGVAPLDRPRPGAPPPRQADNFLPTLSVRETALFYATMQLPGSWSAAQRRERIAQVLAAMGLAHTEDTLVGGGGDFGGGVGSTWEGWGLARVGAAPTRCSGRVSKLGYAPNSPSPRSVARCPAASCCVASAAASASA
jgi:hypothetical protein